MITIKKSLLSVPQKFTLKKASVTPGCFSMQASISSKMAIFIESLSNSSESLVITGKIAKLITRIKISASAKGNKAVQTFKQLAINSTGGCCTALNLFNKSMHISVGCTISTLILAKPSGRAKTAVEVPSGMKKSMWAKGLTVCVKTYSSSPTDLRNFSKLFLVELAVLNCNIPSCNSLETLISSSFTVDSGVS
ncbi:hypothetical protein FF38_03237 [Lucilia cuprina]|uniref:Uncharacterized protein n=1 Tax=Lucilia cuprina TaxID=7375 RepID=A0A0L0BP37_LUCCU|nr:hypothetical protein FF38_03237 [Lucilia cuprina]